ncbi:MAG: glutamate synthase large subunit [Luteitalea sp.]|nr:glutamate synthase large subunit [Luteitalea sp.]
MDPYPQRPQGGLYTPDREHDACGVGFLVHLKGRASHEIVRLGLDALERLAHRAATGGDCCTGDGAGILIQIPHKLFQREAALGRIVSDETTQPLTDLPVPGRYAAGLFFGSPDPQANALAKMLFAMVVRQEGQQLLGWRRVPTDNRSLGDIAKGVEPAMDHVFIAPGEGAADEDAFERKLLVIRKRFQTLVRTSGIDDRTYFYVASLSCRTLVYKGMLTPMQLREYFADLDDRRIESALCMFHSRFSTNTFPSWELAHPYRFVAHNGEINTLRGNINWMRAREAQLASPLLDGDISKILPVVREGLSDSACFDSVLELLAMGGRSLPHAVMMMIPEAWERHEAMSAEKKAFYAYHSCLMEPWDGPACICFTDGRQIGAVLDRNGLRPARYWVTKDDLVILGSEVGILDVPADRIVEKGRLRPGRMFLVDLGEQRIIGDDELKHRIATEQPYQQWVAENLIPLEQLDPADLPAPLEGDALRTRQLAFGYTQEELKLLVTPMAAKGEEAVGSMGNDAALAVLSQRPRALADYFQQLFAQVTNPPLDAIRERLVTSVTTAIGPERNLLDPEPESCRMILCDSPFLDNEEMARFKALAYYDRAGHRHAPNGRISELQAPVSTEDRQGPEPGNPYYVTVLDMVFPVREGDEGLEPALKALFAKVDIAIGKGAKVLVLSDRAVDADHAPIPSLLAVAGLQNHLVREGTRTHVTLIVETGEAREVHQFATLIGYGASAINPWLALETLPTLGDLGLVDSTIPVATLRGQYLKAVQKGVVKVMSKMGISTIASYRGAQVFEAVGLSKEFVDKYFTHTPSRIGGVGIREIARETLMHHARAFRPRPALPELDSGGQYQWRREGEHHLFNPETVFRLQHATRSGRYEIFRDYTRMVDEQSERLATLRGLFVLRAERRPPVPIDEVEPVDNIVTRFCTGAMSYGAISAEAHETLAVAMNRLGGRSNCGEGGEDPQRYILDPNGDSRRSAIKQVASARFGVTSEYLVNGDELQIKMAQGAKPGEGGQLPGNKVYPWIAKVRFSTPGVGLISPPPHHDIYSIEDLAQLIFDLKNANPRARVSVKLVAEVGVGTVAAGVAKAKSDHVLISGHDGGTGASPLTSIKHAGIPWELGLAETQQTLIANDLRDRIVVQVDGQLKTGRDVVVAALLGAEEYGFATAPLVVMGCVMMRVCHLDTCPVGIATQNPELRKKFTGTASHVVNFFRFIAQEVREYLAQLGFRTLDEMIGRTDLLDVQPAIAHWKARDLDLSTVLHAPWLEEGLESEVGMCAVPLRSVTPQDHGLERVLDNQLIKIAEPALLRRERVTASLPIRNINRATGSMLGSEVTRRFGAEGLPDDTIELQFTGSAGQSFGAFLPRGIALQLEGDANDYVGKGLSGGRLVIVPPPNAGFVPEQNIIAGNVMLYGATSGELFVRGVVGERFAVRNSGAHAVVEGVGDHGCEYMTGGRVVVLGSTGRNFGAGMSGGISYVLDARGGFEWRCNQEMVALEALEEDDEALVQELLRKHHLFTGSPVAERLLERWPGEARSFVKVMPIDYKRALERERQEELALVASA